MVDDDDVAWALDAEDLSSSASVDLDLDFGFAESRISLMCCSVCGYLAKSVSCES